jgi:hypothetical protein
MARHMLAELTLPFVAAGLAAHGTGGARAAQETIPVNFSSNTSYERYLIGIVECAVRRRAPVPNWPSKRRNWSSFFGK